MHLFQHSVSAILCMYMFMGLLAQMVNAMGSRPLRLLEGWGRDSMVSKLMLQAGAYMSHEVTVTEVGPHSSQQKS